MTTETNRLRPMSPLGMNLNICVFYFIIYNIYIICPLICLFFNISRSISSGGLLSDFQFEQGPHTKKKILTSWRGGGMQATIQRWR
jgi:hypothetical protein